MEHARLRRTEGGRVRAATERLRELEDDLRPRRHRRRVHAEIDAMFRSGHVPLPALGGFHPGRLVTFTTVGPIDRVGRVLADLWLPWLGKHVEPSGSTGTNVLSRAVQPLLRVAFRDHELRPAGTRLEAFPFRLSPAPSMREPGLQVLRFDYDLPENPPLIRRIVDELVEVDDGTYLGRAYVHVGRRPVCVAYFSLER